MKYAALLPLLLVLAGCRPAPNLAPVVYPNDASQLTAEAFIAEATAREWPLNEFYEEFGVPRVKDGEGGTLNLFYVCRDQRVGLMVDPAKFRAGIIDVIEGEKY
jgi:hypothetical protein